MYHFFYDLNIQPIATSVFIGSIAIIAWMCFINIGSIIVRWYKPLWSGKIILGSAVWFIVSTVKRKHTIKPVYNGH